MWEISIYNGYLSSVAHNTSNTTPEQFPSPPGQADQTTSDQTTSG
ncbi:MAG: hypothetical protein AAF702_11620 [Chloroflexota bacterium]